MGDCWRAAEPYSAPADDHATSTLIRHRGGAVPDWPPAGYFAWGCFRYFWLGARTARSQGQQAVIGTLAEQRRGICVENPAKPPTNHCKGSA